MRTREKCTECEEYTFDYIYIGLYHGRHQYACSTCYDKYDYEGWLEEQDRWERETTYKGKDGREYIVRREDDDINYYLNQAIDELNHKVANSFKKTIKGKTPEEIAEEERLKKEEEERKRREQEIRERKERQRKREKMMEKVNQFVGIKQIKTKIEEWLIRLEGEEMFTKKTGIEVKGTPMHIVLTGNPGVGKTTFARMLTDILYESGKIKERKMIEVKAEDLVAEYVGHTAQKTTKMIEKAEGGLFFLDEAYRLTTGFASNHDKGSFGLEALETIMGHMEKNDCVFVFAGYEDKMQEFVNANEGFRSRISEFFPMSDYTLEELMQIAEKALSSKGYKTELIMNDFTTSVKSRMQQGILKGNGRTIHTFVDKIIEKHMIRITKSEDIEDFHTILPEDVQNAFRKSDISQEGLKQIFDEAKEEINKLIGLSQVKSEVNRIANVQYIQQKRRDLGLKTDSKSYHMLFLGNPGTGKTTLARLMGQLFRGAGVLANGHFIEATKDMLTAGSSIPKTVKSLVDKAIGGILFIDEVYMLANDGKGKEALDSLIPLMENRKDEFICIMAGYEADVKVLFNVNKGLSSRLPYHFTFEDYTSNELFEMAITKIESEGYQLQVEADAALKEVIELSVLNNQTDGNGRWVRNLFEQFIVTQSERLVSFEEQGNVLAIDDFIILTSQDIYNAHENLVSLLSTATPEKKEFVGEVNLLKKDKIYA